MILAAVHGPIPAWICGLSPGFLRHLIDPAVRSLSIASVIGLVMVVTRVKDLSLRLSVWKAVVCAALAMPVLAICLPALPVQLPVSERIAGIFGNAAKMEVPTQVFVAQSPRQISDLIPSPQPIAMNFVAPSARVAVSRNFHAERPDISWSTVAVAVYSTGAVFLAFRFLVGWFLSQKLRHASRTIRDIGIVRRFRMRCDKMRLREIPRLAESDRLSVPLTCGVLRPAVLLPVDWRTWDADKLDAVLTHEISHVARRDALTERLALLHRIVFWFSPLAWWLPRCLADLAEEASDQAALAAGAEPTKYAEILLGFFEDLNSASWRAHWQGVAMAPAGSAEKRLDRILNGRTIMSKHGKKTFVAVAIFASVPVVLVAASLQPQRLGKQIVLDAYPSRPVTAVVTTSQSSTPVAPAPAATVVAAPLAAPIASAEVAPVPKVFLAPIVSALPAPQAISVVAVRARPVVSVSIVPIALAITPGVSVQAQAPTSPQAPVVAPAPPPLAPLSPGRYSYSTDHENSYAIISGSSQAVHGSFGYADIAKLQTLRSKLNSDFIWFERDGKFYIITEPETVRRAIEANAAEAESSEQVSELIGRQGTLGELQGVLGEQLGVLGEQLGQIRSEMQDLKVEVPDMTQELQSLRLKTQELSQTISQKDMDAMGVSIAQMQEEIAEATKQLNETQIRSDVAHAVDSAALEAAMNRAHAAIDEQMAKFSAEQSKLSEQQQRLSEEQAELSRRQAKAEAKAEAEINAIIDQALSRGIVQPAPKQ